MDTLWQDVRYGVRALIRSPGFTLAALITLALGIGVNAAIFSVVNGVLLRPLPYPEAGQLYRIAERHRSLPGMTADSIVSAGTLEAWQALEPRVVESLAGYIPRSLTLTLGPEPVRIQAAAVSPALLPMLRARPARGRTFRDDEARPGADRVAVVSHGFWQNRLASAPDVIGRQLTIDGNPHTIIGVTRPDFYFPNRDTELWIPLVLVRPPQRHGERIEIAVAGLVRLGPGADVRQAEAEGSAIFQRTERVFREQAINGPPPGPAGNEIPDQPSAGQSPVMRRRGAPPGDDRRAGPPFPSSPPPPGINLIPLHEHIVGNVRPALLVLAAAAAFVLLIAAVNLANLQLARGAARHRELAVRAAIGATRRRLARQLLTESLVLSVAGGTLGLLVAYWLVQVLPAISPPDFPRLTEIALDPGVLIFTVGLSLATGTFFGLAPALVGSRMNLLQSLADSRIVMGGSTVSRPIGGRSILAVAEIALALVLLVGAGLLTRSFVRLIDVDPGYDPANVLTAQLNFPRRPEGDGRAMLFLEQLQARMTQLPEVSAAGLVTTLPLVPGQMILGFNLADRPPNLDGGPNATAALRVIGPGYLEAMGVRLVGGRFFTRRDTGASAPVLLVNESFANKYFPGEDLVGRRLEGVVGPTAYEVVGIVGDVRHAGLDADPQPELYQAVAQLPEEVSRGLASRMHVAVRSRGNPLDLVPALRGIVADLDKDVTVDNVMTMERRVAASVAAPRFYMLMLGAFAALALLLAAVGIYGILAYGVSQRRREIAIRLALGARGESILAMVLGQGIRLTAAGVAIGLAGAFLVTRVLAGLLFGTSANDPATYAIGAALMASVAFAACWFPARRAARIAPLEALRDE